MAELDVQKLTKVAMSRVQRASCWTATGVEGPQRQLCLSAGARDDVQWFGFAPFGPLPTVVLTREHALVRADNWVIGQFFQFWPVAVEAAVAGRWLRSPIKPFRRENPDIVPGRRLTEGFSWPAQSPLLVGVEDVDGRRVAFVEAGTRPNRSVWRVGLDDDRLVVPTFAGFELTIDFAQTQLPVALPDEAEVVDKLEILAMLRGPRRPRTKPTVTRVPGIDVFEVPRGDSDGESGDRGPWTVLASNLVDLLGSTSYVDAEESALLAVSAADPALATRVSFDSGSDGVWVRCNTEDDARAVAAVIWQFAADQQGMA